MANTADHRYIRTEEAIRSSFMELVAEQPVGAITASAVCRRAGISRNAFYLHHSGIAELYSALIGELLEDIRSVSLASAEKRMATGYDDELSESIIIALSHHEQLLRALIPSDDGSLAKRLAEGIEEGYVEAALAIGEHGGSAEHRLNCAYAAWALVGMVSRWIALTERPITEAREQFGKLAASTVEVSAQYLMGS